MTFLKSLLLITALTLPTLAFAANPARNATHRDTPQYLRLTQAAQALGPNGVNKAMDTINTGEELDITLSWLQDQMQGQAGVPGYPPPMNTVDSSYTALYAKALASAAEKWSNMKSLYGSAFVTMGVFDLMGSIDAARCEDKSVVAHIHNNARMAMGIYEQRAPEAVAEAKKALPGYALAYEEKLKSRPANPAICKTGLGAMRGNLDKVVKSEPAGAANGFVGGQVVTVDTSSYTPTYIPDEEWNAKRTEMRTSYESQKPR